jgi:hypothetical protein
MREIKLLQEYIQRRAWTKETLLVQNLRVIQAAAETGTTEITLASRQAGRQASVPEIGHRLTLSRKSLSPQQVQSLEGSVCQLSRSIEIRHVHCLSEHFILDTSHVLYVIQASLSARSTSSGLSEGRSVACQDGCSS